MNRQFLPALLLLFILIPLSVPQSVSADPQPYVFTNPVAFFSSKYFQIHAISGTISNDGVNYVTTLHPTVTVNIIGEYGDFTFYFSPSEGNTTLEFHIPDCYAGIDIWEGGVLKTGTENYTLSVPYVYNNGTVTVRDWKTLALATPTGADGTYKRIQLVSNKTDATNLTCRIYYATEPAVGFDGVDDYIYVGSTLWNQPTYVNVTYTIVPQSTQVGVFGSNANPIQFFLFSASCICFLTDSAGTTSGYLDPDFAVSAYEKTTISLVWNGTHIYAIKNGVEDSAYLEFSGTGSLKPCYPFLGNVRPNAEWSCLRVWNALWVNTSLGTQYFNVSSLSGTSSTVVTDFSGAGNNGTADGGVQHKVYTGTGFRATLTFTPDTHYTLTFTDVSYPTVAPSYSPVTITGSILLNGSTPTIDDWVDANIPIYNATHVILSAVITQSGETLSTLYYVPINGSLSIPFLTVQKPYNNQYTLSLSSDYTTLSVTPYAFNIASPYISFYGFTIYSSTASPTGLGYLSSTGKLQLLASGNLTIVQPSGVQPPDRILINGVPYYDWSYSLDDNSISITVPASQYTATVYYKSDITATISIIFAAITLMTTVLIVLAAFLILAFLRQSQNPGSANISLSYETGAAITIIATILLVGTLIISAIWSAI